MIKKRGILFLCLVFLLAVQLISASSTGPCTLTTSIINQDPYPAVPGDYVKLVFQVEGTENSNCGDTSITLNEAFPFSLDPEAQKIYSTNNFFERDYSSFLIAPYKVRVDKEALDGDNPLEVAITRVKDGVSSKTLEKFNIDIEDKRATFEVYVKNYNPLTNILTLEILNTGKYDVKAVTIVIPEQNNISIKGAKTNVVGDLDSNEYTTADFEAVSKGGEIKLEVLYTDGIDVRRSVESSIVFNPAYFSGRKSQEKSSKGAYIIGIIILALAGFFIYRRYKKKQKKVY